MELFLRRILCWEDPWQVAESDRAEQSSCFKDRERENVRGEREAEGEREDLLQSVTERVTRETRKSRTERKRKRRTVQ